VIISLLRVTCDIEGYTLFSQVTSICKFFNILRNLSNRKSWRSNFVPKMLTLSSLVAFSSQTRTFSAIAYQFDVENLNYILVRRRRFLMMIGVGRRLALLFNCWLLFHCASAEIAWTWLHVTIKIFKFCCKFSKHNRMFQNVNHQVLFRISSNTDRNRTFTRASKRMLNIIQYWTTL